MGISHSFPAQVEDATSGLSSLRLAVLDKRAFIAPDRLGDVDVDLRPYVVDDPPDEPDGAPWERHACLRATDATSFPLNAPQEQNILWLAKDKVQPPAIALAIKIFKARVS